MTLKAGKDAVQSGGTFWLAAWNAVLLAFCGVGGTSDRAAKAARTAMDVRSLLVIFAPPRARFSRSLQDIFVACFRAQREIPLYPHAGLTSLLEGASAHSSKRPASG